MSKMKKIVGMMLAVVMVLAMSVAVLAADTTYTITITYSESGHTYEAYQIFTGDLDTTGKILSNIVWGSGVKSSDLLTALQGDTTVVTVTDPDDNTQTKEVTVASLFSSCSTAADVAKVLSDNNDSDELAERFAQLASENLSDTVAGTSTQSASPYTIAGLTAGYYLVKDQDNSVTGDDAYTDIILEVVSNVTVDAKADTTTLDKIISDTTTDTNNGDTTADYDIGDDVPFTLTATLPSTYDDYKVYKLTFHDTLSSGLSFNNDVVVTVYKDAADTTGTVVETGYTVVADCYHVANITAFDGITTYYTLASGVYTEVATGTTFDDAETYYVKADCTFEVQIADTNALYDANGILIEVTNSSRIVVTYTAELTDSAKKVETNKASVEYSNNPNDDGSGTGETTEDITTVFTFDLTVNKVDEDGAALSGAGFTLYKYNGSDYVAVGSEVTGGTSFEFDGLGVGNYKLVETTTPDGYNTMDDICFTIVAETAEAANGTASVTSLVIKDADGNTISEGTGATFTATASTQQIGTEITNKKGSTLPTTGGIGTTVFYVVGGVLVLGAAVLLITKKRMSGAR